MKKHLETWWKSCSHPRDQLSPIPPNEYAARFVKFIRASIKTREEVAQERMEETSAVAPLSTIEEQEDRRIMERAQKQTRKESESHGEKEEMNVGRTTALSPSHERPEQVLPSVTVANNEKQEHGSDSEKRAGTDETGEFTGRDIVRSLSPMEGEIVTRQMHLQDGSFVKGKRYEKTLDA